MKYFHLPLTLLFLLVTSCTSNTLNISTNNIEGRYLRDGKPQDYIEFKSDKTTYAQAEIDTTDGLRKTKKLLQASGTFSVSEKEITVNNSGMAQKFIINGNKLTETKTNTVFIKE